jgi:hypothetical protein
MSIEWRIRRAAVQVAAFALVVLSALADWWVLGL